jgi:RNA polymerase sigma-70 factor (ECF subfamily)
MPPGAPEVAARNASNTSCAGATSGGPGGIKCKDMVFSVGIRLASRAVGDRRATGDAALVARARGGDHRAFEDLVRRHKDGVLNLARRMVADADAAEDVTQEALIKAYRQLHRFRGNAAFSTWLYRIAVNEARGYLRSQGRRQARWEKQRDMEASETPPPEPGEQQGPLVALLQELPEKQRAALALFYLEELSLAQIADAVGAPVGTVKAWLSRGRDRLRRLAKERGVL